MSVELIEKGKDKLEVRFREVNASVADILHYELLADSSVLSSGVVIPHPLQKVVVLNVLAKEQPKAALREAWARSMEVLESLESELDKSLTESSKE